MTSISSTVSTIENDITLISVYPNPTKSALNLSITVDNLELLNISGKVISKYKNINSIDVSDLTSGTYLIRSKINGKYYLNKFIKE
jgi:hypothetical protein